MRWDLLFDDLEARFAAEERRELDSEIADRTRHERAQVELGDRLVAMIARPLRVRLITGTTVHGSLVDIGHDWLLLCTEGAQQLAQQSVIPLGSVVGVTGLDQRSSAERTTRRFGLGYVLRGLSRDRAGVTITDRSGQRVSGTIDVVGSDFVDLAVHALGETRRAANVRERHTVPFAGIVCVAAR